MAGIIDEMMAQVYGLSMPEIPQMSGLPQMPFGPTPAGQELLDAQAAAAAPPLFEPPPMEMPEAAPLDAMGAEPVPGGIFGYGAQRPALPPQLATNPLMGRFNEVYNAGLSQTPSTPTAAPAMLRAQTPPSMQRTPVHMQARGAAQRIDPRISALRSRTPRFFDRIQHLQGLRARKGI